VNAANIQVCTLLKDEERINRVKLKSIWVAIIWTGKHMVCKQVQIM